MKWKTVVLLFVVISAILISACNSPLTSTREITPPIDVLTVETFDGKGVIRLIMREAGDGISVKEMEDIKDELEEMKPKYHPNEGPEVVFVVPQSSENDTQIVAFGYAVYEDEVARAYFGSALNTSSVDEVYENASDWLLQELASHQ